MTPQPLSCNDGFTSFRAIDSNTIELVAMSCDIQLTREEIAELAQRFPVSMSWNCGNCRFGLLETCHRNAPRPRDFPICSEGGILTNNTEWPAVEPTDWCGEFQPREAPVAALDGFVFRTPGPAPVVLTYRKQRSADA